MSTAIREDIGLFDEKGDLQLSFFLNKSDGLTILTDETMDAPYQQFWTATKEDWEAIRDFIDNQFKNL